MPQLEVPGASLFYETYGAEDKPLLLCISGGNGDADPWRPLAMSLQSTFKVCVYDRRGFSHSALTDKQDYANRLATDADDAAALIRHLSPNDNKIKATAIGSSSGAIVAIELLTRHADHLATVFAHEPPAMAYLPDFEELWKRQQAVYDIYRAEGLFSAMPAFGELTQTSLDVGMIKHMLAPSARSPWRAANMTYWFEREFLVYVKRTWELQDLERVKGKLVLLLGKGSPETALQYRGNVELGKLLGLDTDMVSGDHFGYASHGQAFAEEMRGVLSKRG